MKPFIPWVGGKRRLAKHILPLFPEHRCYVEPFAGAAALFFMKEPAPVEVLNDVNGDLVNLYRVVKHHLEEFVRSLKWTLASRQEFAREKATAPETLTDIQRAVRFYYLQKLSFGAKVHGQHFGTSAVAPPRLNLLRIEEDLSAAHLRLARTLIEHLSWEECIRRYDRPGTLFYLDPPYHETEGYGVPFPETEYFRIAEVIRNIQGKAIISINATPLTRDAFAGFSVTEVDLRYTVGGTCRAKTATRELIIRNWR